MDLFDVVECLAMVEERECGNGGVPWLSWICSE